MNEARPLTTRIDVRALLLVGLVLAAYGPIYGAGFLNYDDPWLIADNPYFAPDAWRTPLVAFTDFSQTTRLGLGAEYLPMRDLFVWLETRLFGMSAPALHTMSVLAYAAAVLLLRRALILSIGPGLVAELTMLLFALHPLHVESVAWLAGQKDVLALLFIGLALALHAKGARHSRFTVPLCVAAASLSKSMSVAVLVLLAAQDYVKRRRPDRVLYAGAITAVGVTMAAHLYVGRVVGMLAEPAGGSRLNALITMGPVWLRYLAHCLWPTRLSVAYDVPDRTHWDLASIAGYAFIAVSLALAVLAHRRGRRLVGFAWLWFFAPLAPVSQVLAPLQNRMADRYLWLSVLAPCLLLAAAVALAYERAEAAWPRRALLGVSGVLIAALALGTVNRAVTFSDSVLLFADATAKTQRDLDAPYQLGKALEEQQRDEEAIAAFRIVLTRAPTGNDPTVAHATNNLAKLAVARGDVRQAEAALRSALRRFPGDAKLTRNLVKILRARALDAEADALEASLDSGRDRKR